MCIYSVGVYTHTHTHTHTHTYIYALLSQFVPLSSSPPSPAHMFLLNLCVSIPVLQIGSLVPHSSTFAWRIPRTEEPGGLQSMGSLESDTTERLHFHFHALEKEMATHSSVLAWRIPGMGKPGGLPSMGSHRVGHN